MKKSKTWLVMSIIVSVTVMLGVLTGCGDAELQQDVTIMSESEVTTVKTTAIISNDSTEITVTTSTAQDSTEAITLTPTPVPVPGEFLMDLDEDTFGAAAWIDVNGNMWFTDTGEYIGFNVFVAGNTP